MAKGKPKQTVKSKQKRKPKLKSQTITKRPKRAVPETPLPPPRRTSRVTCPSCHGPAHEGTSEESLIALNPEAAVFYDRDVADTDLVAGLCGPRFRLSGGRLHAHYGWPGSIYKAFEWSPTTQSWALIIDTSPRSR